MIVAKRNKREINREVRHIMYGENAKKAIGTLEKGCEIYGLSKGQFSIINIIEEILKQTGKADVLISTWTAANAEIKKAENFLENGTINKISFIVDRSFKTRQPKYYKMLIEKFGDIVYTTNSHAKFILIKNDEWNMVVRTSMNLNENKRLENFEISDCKVLYDYMSEIASDIMGVNYSYFEFEKLGKESKYDNLRPVSNNKLDDCLFE